MSSAACAAGLTVGLLSIDSLKLQIKLAVGTETEKRAARRILPLISNHHLLLCTLLLFNSLANEALPIFLDGILPSWAAVLISVTMVLLCGEVIPTALFTGPNQLSIASAFSPLVYVLECVFYPVAYPLARLLDRVLGEEEEEGFNRDEIGALVQILRENRTRQVQEQEDASRDPAKSHKTAGRRNNTKQIEAESQKEETPLSENEVNVITGVLGLAKLAIRDVCIPLHKVNMLSVDQVLDRTTIEAIDKVGHSRLPIFKGSDTRHIIGFFLVKRLINVNPDLGLPLKDFQLNQLLVVGASQSLLDVLTLFQSGHSHMALVSEQPAELNRCIALGIPPTPGSAPIGVCTIEDVFEKMIQAQIYDEEDRDKSMNQESASFALREMAMRSSSAVGTDASILADVMEAQRMSVGPLPPSVPLPIKKTRVPLDPVSEGKATQSQMSPRSFTDTPGLFRHFGGGSPQGATGLGEPLLSDGKAKEKGGKHTDVSTKTVLSDGAWEAGTKFRAKTYNNSVDTATDSLTQKNFFRTKGLTPSMVARYVKNRAADGDGADIK
jgi:metal transporter CNNM